MAKTRHIVALNRRTLLVQAAAASVLAPTFAWAGAPTGLERSAQFKDAFDKLVAGATPTAARLSVDLPEIAENGNFVPLAIAVDSPMTEADHIKAIHVLSTANPFAHVATFRLSPLNGMARVTSRIRLAKTQDVIVLAEHSGGALFISTTLVKVTLGGCAG